MLDSWRDAPVKLKLSIPVQPPGEDGNPLRVAIGLSEGTTNFDNSVIASLTAGDYKKIAIEVGETGVEATAEAYNWQAPTGIKGTPIATRNIGGDDDGTAGLSLVGAPIDLGAYYEFSGSAQALAGSDDLGDSSAEDMFVLFRAHNRTGGAQALWQDGANTNGVAAGIDASGNIGIFGRSGGTLTSITIPPASYSDNVWYELWCTRTRVSLVEVSTGTVIATQTGTCTSADGTGKEGLAYAQQGSVILGGSSKDYFDGDIDTVEIYTSGDLSAPNVASGDIYIAESVLSLTDPVHVNIYIDPSHEDNSNITLITSPPASYWDAAALVTWEQYAAAYLEFISVLTPRVSLSFTQQIVNADYARYGYTQVVAMARVASLAFNQAIASADPAYLEFIQSLSGYHTALIAFDQVFSALGYEAAIEFAQAVSAYGYDVAAMQFNQVISTDLLTQTQEISLAVTVAGVSVNVQAVSFDRSGVAITADITLRRKADYDFFQIGDEVRLWWLGTEYHLILESKLLSDIISQGVIDIPYTFFCASHTVQLTETISPELVASRLTGSFPAGTMASELLDYVMDGVGNWDLQVNDFPIGAIEFEDQDRISVLRTIFPGGNILDQEWVINTSPTGTLTIDRFFGDIVPELLSTAEPDKIVHCKSKSLTPAEGLLYTQVKVYNYNQTATAQGLTIEVVDNGDGTGAIKGYSVPWTDKMTLDHSAVSGLIVSPQGATTEEITDDQVEFQAGVGSLSKPVYSALTIDWINNDNLGTITAEESGVLKASSGGDSVAKITYTTKYMLWTYSNNREEVAQVSLGYS